MPKTRIVDGKAYTFPDDATEEEIAEALNAQLPPGGAQADGAVPAQATPAGPTTLSKVNDLYNRYLSGWVPDAVESTVGGVAKDVADVVANPIKNAPSIGGTIGGLVGGAVPKIASKLTGVKIPNVTGAAMSGLGGAAGEAIRQLYGAATGDVDADEAPLAQTPQAMIRAMLTEGGRQGAAELGGRYVSALGRGASNRARGVYEGLLKPTKETLRHAPGFSESGFDEAVKRIVDTGLRENIPVGARGIAKADRLIDADNAEIDALIAGSNATIDPKRVATRLDEVEDFFAKGDAPQADVASVRGLRNEFLSDPKLQKPLVQAQPMQTLGAGQMTSAPILPVRNASGQVVTRPGRIPVQTAQENKKATGAILSKKAFGELKGPEVEGRKALRRGWKEEIATAVPGVDPVNARESGRIALRDAIDDAMPRIGNRNPFSLGDLIALVNLPRAAPVLAGSMANKPMAGNAAARGLYRTGKMLNPTTGRAVAEGLRYSVVPRLTEGGDPTQLSEEDLIRQLLLSSQ